MAEHCYVYVESENIIGVVNNGETGYYRTDILECNHIKTPDEARNFVDELNAKLRVSKGEAMAMVWGSMYGWDTPGADTENWNDDGTPKKAETET